MSDIKKLLTIFNESTTSGSVAAGAGRGKRPADTIFAAEDSDCSSIETPNSPANFDLWKNSKLIGKQQNSHKKVAVNKTTMYPQLGESYKTPKDMDEFNDDDWAEWDAKVGRVGDRAKKKAKLDRHYNNIMGTSGLSDGAKKQTTDIYNKLKENEGVAEGEKNDDNEPFNYEEWKASKVKPSKPRGHKDAEALGKAIDSEQSELRKRKKQDVAEGERMKTASGMYRDQHTGVAYRGKTGQDGNDSYMTPDYLIQKYQERLAQIASGPYKRPKEVAQLKSRIAKLQGQQDVAEGKKKDKNDDNEPFNYDEWKKSTVKPRQPRGHKDSEALGKAIDSEQSELRKRKEQGVAKESLNEFSTSGGGGGGDGELFALAKMWYNGDLETQHLVEKTLQRQGLDIGENEDENGGAYISDASGDHYESWTHADLEENRPLSGQDKRQWSNKDMERLRVATRDIDGILDAGGPDKIKQDIVKKRIKTNPMSGPKGYLPEEGVAEGLGDTQKKIEDTINKLEDRLKHAKSDEQWDRISARIERLQAGLNRSKQGVAKGSEITEEMIADRLKDELALFKSGTKAKDKAISGKPADREVQPKKSTKKDSE